MNNRLKLFVIAILVIGATVISQPASAQYGYDCHRGYGVGYGSYSYGYPAPLGYGYGYTSYYAGYPGYISHFTPRAYSGTSLYVAPGRYSTARIVVPAYPVYRPVITPVPFGPGFIPAPGVGLRVGF